MLHNDNSSNTSNNDDNNSYMRCHKPCLLPTSLITSWINSLEKCSPCGETPFHLIPHLSSVSAHTSFSHQEGKSGRTCRSGPHPSEEHWPVESRVKCDTLRGELETGSFGGANICQVLLLRSSDTQHQEKLISICGPRVVPRNSGPHPTLSRLESYIIYFFDFMYSVVS